MPITKYPKTSEPLWKEWDYKAQKKGVHHTVYSVNGDQYTGEWNDNKKNGKLTLCYEGNVQYLLITDDIFYISHAKEQCNGIIC